MEGASVGVARFLDDVRELLGVRLCLEAADDVDHEAFAKGEDFVVVMSDGHFKVETGELTTSVDFQSFACVVDWSNVLLLDVFLYSNFRP